MPRYDFMCATCAFVVEDVQLPIADRQYPTTQPCPQCGATTIELCAAAPYVGDAIRQGRTHLPSTWTDKLHRIKSSHRHSTIKIPAPAQREV